MSVLIHQYLEASTELHPHALAVSYLDEKLDFSELNYRSDQMAACLRGLGINRGDRVGIYMRKCLHVPVALYGILKAGAAYVPLDPSAPPERTAQLIISSDIRMVASTADNCARLEEISTLANCIETVIGPEEETETEFRTLSWEAMFDQYRPTVEPVAVESDDLAYIMFTSGSTGQPKGIMHTHRSCLAFSRWAASEYCLTSTDRLSNHAPLHFDLSIFDYFAAAVAGAATIIVPEEYTRMPASYSQLLAEQGVTVFFTVPFALIQLCERGALDQRRLGALRWVIFGGEPMSTKYLRQLMIQLPHTNFDNMYGPAEVNGVSHFTVTAEAADVDSIPVGPINSISRALVVDGDDREVRDGQAGELLVSTPSMMKAYWRAQELNHCAFLYRDGHRYYRTGDLVRESENGNLWFIGRKDRQVKVRGYRVELDEIEAALNEHTAIEEAGVFAVNGQDLLTRIGAVVSLKEPAVTNESDLLSYLKSRLPWYAVPACVDVREHLPRTSSGKIDRRTLSLEAGL